MILTREEISYVILFKSRVFLLYKETRSFKLCVLKYFMVVYLPSYLDPERTFYVYNDSH